MRKPASRRNHTNVLQHIQGYLKRKLDDGDRAELDDTIEQYRLGYLPLIVPITILRHHFTTRDHLAISCDIEQFVGQAVERDQASFVEAQNLF